MKNKKTPGRSVLDHPLFFMAKFSDLAKINIILDFKNR
jgi:hypothetical protein